MTRVVCATALSLLAFSGLAGCNQQPKADPAAEAAKIEAVEQGMLAAYTAKDVAKLVSAYTADAALYVPGARARVGTKALTEGDKADLADPAFKLAFINGKTKVSASGDVGYTQGSFTLNYTDPKTKKPVTERGYYLTVFEKQADGSWKAVEDMATPNGD